MAKLPVTVTAIVNRGGGLYGVTVAFSDFTTANYVIPASLATFEAVKLSALAMAVLSETNIAAATAPHHKHRRYDPRT